MDDFLSPGCHAVTIGAGYFRNQSMPTQACDFPGDAAGSPALLLGIRSRLSVEMFLDVTIVEMVQAVGAISDGLEEVDGFWGERVDAWNAPFMGGFGPGERIEVVDRRLGGPNGIACCDHSLIAFACDTRQQPEVCDPFAQGGFPLPGCGASSLGAVGRMGRVRMPHDPEGAGIVDGGLEAR